MYDTLGFFRALLKWDKVKADNFLFRLHCKVTFAILVVSGIVVTAKQYVGDPIDCITSAAVEKVIDQYCWVHSTYTVATKDQFGRFAYSSVQGAHPGVHGFLNGREVPEEKIYHRYYQWVCFVLFLQSVLFYMPNYIWRIWEAGRLKRLVSDLKLPSFRDQKERVAHIVDYFAIRQGHWFSYTYRFYFCECLNLVNVIGQIYLMDTFLGNTFSSFGLELLQFTENEPYNRTDALAKIFPKVTKCTFNAHGFGGNIVNHDALCVLSVNNINEKIYIFLWFWFLALATISILCLPFRLLTMCSSSIRFLISRMDYHSDQCLPQLRAVIRRLTGADWFVLCQIGKNINSPLYTQLIIDLAERFSSTKPKSIIRRENHDDEKKSIGSIRSIRCNSIPPGSRVKFDGGAAVTTAGGGGVVEAHHVYSGNLGDVFYSPVFV